MTTKFKLLAATFAAILFTPALAFGSLGVSGSTTLNASTSAQGKMGIDFCSNVANIASQLNSKTTGIQNQLAVKQQQRIQLLQVRQTKRAQELVKIRLQEDQQRAAIYAKLSAKATTTAQTQAVASFQATINTAIATRRSAVDSALAAYWTGVMTAVNTRQIAINTATKNFVSALQAAANTANKECASGTASLTVKSHFTSSLSAARIKFETDRKAIDKSNDQIKTLTKTRNAAIQKAAADFKASAEKARVTLKAAFSVS